MITPDNWTFTYYKSLELKASIGYGAEPNHSEQVQELYFVNLTDHEDKELFQTVFQQLAPALNFINQKYSHWEWVNQLKSGEKNGCSSCQAHD